MHYAAFRGRPEIAKLLIEAKADLNAKDEEGLTPLDTVLTKNTKDLLLKHGAKNSVEIDYPLHYAAANGHNGVAKALIESGRNVNAKIESRWWAGWTPLHFATRNGHTDTVKMLIQKRAEVNTKDWQGWTPLHSAAGSGDTGMAAALLAAGAEVNVKTTSGIYLGWTPLSSAHTEEMRVFLRKHGAKTGDELDAEAKQGKK